MNVNVNPPHQSPAPARLAQNFQSSTKQYASPAPAAVVIKSSPWLAEEQHTREYMHNVYVYMCRPSFRSSVAPSVRLPARLL